MLSDQQDTSRRNTQAIASISLGVISIVFSAFNYASGLLSVLGIVGAVAALLALLAGVRGLRAAREIGGQGNRLSIAGLAAGGIGIVLFVVTFVLPIADSVSEMEALLTPPPQKTYQGDGFTLTYPNDWEELDISGQDFCLQTGIDCLLAIGHPSGDGTNINLMRYSIVELVDIEELDEVLWAQFVSSAPDVILESRDMIEVSQLPAVRRAYTVPSATSPGGRSYIIQVSAANELVVYQFTAWASSADVMAPHVASIEAIIQSFQLSQ
jgi:hypothetical protein